jgi:hypothetical protein
MTAGNPLFNASHQTCHEFRQVTPRRSAQCKLLLWFALIGTSAAQVLTGTVTNGTTNKPAAGDDVVLIKLAQGMDEVGRTKTDAKGAFTFKLTDPNAPHLMRAIHQGVPYHQMAPPGMPSVDMQVYDVATKLQDVSVTADVIRLQATEDSLQVTRRFAVNNSSSPPRTQMNDRNFEFYLPSGAQLESGMAKTANGQPVNSAPVPQKEKDRYAFIFPLRPGQTEFQVAFRMPYSGEATIDPRALYPAQHFVVVLPKSMHFSSQAAGFQSMQDRNQADTTVEVATSTQAGQSLAFKVSGTGTLPEAGAAGATSPSAGSGMGGTNSSSEGGPGSASGASDPLRSYRWFVLGGFVIVVVVMALYIRRRPGNAVAGASASSPGATPKPEAAADFEPGPQAESTFEAPRPALLLEALKEELFQLEVEHKQGRISEEEYTRTRAALDQTLERALKREARV